MQEFWVIWSSHLANSFLRSCYLIRRPPTSLYSMQTNKKLGGHFVFLTKKERKKITPSQKLFKVTKSDTTKLHTILPYSYSNSLIQNIIFICINEAGRVFDKGHPNDYIQSVLEKRKKTAAESGASQTDWRQARRGNFPIWPPLPPCWLVIMSPDRAAPGRLWGEPPAHVTVMITDRIPLHTHTPIHTHSNTTHTCTHQSMYTHMRMSFGNF